MIIKLLLSCLILVFSGCDDKKPSLALDGRKLIKEKCSSCHDISLPPKTSEDEKAPPMMAVTFHIKDFIEAANESEKIPKAKEFVKDYVYNPSAKKSFCDKESLKTYGVMPSQKGNVTPDELNAITEYMFEHFTQENLLKEQALIREFKKMPKGRRIALKYGCLNCHRSKKTLVGPSFEDISKRYKNSPENILKSIKNGSKEKWNLKRKVVMPSFKNIPEDDLKILTKWIINTN